MAIKMPPRLLVFACLLLFGLGELAGAILGGFPKPIQDFAAKHARARPEVHGLAGIEDIDRTILAKVSSETLSRLHTFHLHGHGVGLLAFILFLVIHNAGFSKRVYRLLISLTALGMFYPFGWLTLMLAIPFKGVDAAFQIAERIFFMPFGSALLAAIWLLIFFYGTDVIRSFKNIPASQVS